ncbi:hypothetical protein [Sphingomonas sp.]|uniref:hypothetical protein n=1 Tax=Sphingomonas sp. TaxID=28214 RepID=UPI002E126F4D
MSFVRRFRRAVLTLRTHGHSANGRIAEALTGFEKMALFAPLTPAERLAKSLCLTRAGRFEDSEALLDEVCRDTENATSQNGQYVNLFARQFRADMNGDEQLKSKLIEHARKIRPTAAVEMWLPLEPP